MTKYASKDCGFLLVGPYNLLSTAGKVEDGTTLKVSDITPLGTDEEVWFSGGVRNNTFTQEGWFDDAANSIHDALKGLPASSLPFMFAPNGNTAGAPMWGFSRVERVNYTRQLSAGEVTKANAEYACNGREEGVIVHTLSTQTGDGNGDGAYLDLGAGGYASGGSVYEAITAITGSPTNVTITLRHSADHITFVAAVTMTAATVASAERKTTASAINRYVSWGVAFSGGTAPSVTFALGVAPA